eukprot:2242924-Amphidinium_carterae.1
MSAAAVLHGESTHNLDPNENTATDFVAALGCGRGSGSQLGNQMLLIRLVQDFCCFLESSLNAEVLN